MVCTNYKLEIRRNRDMLSAERSWRTDSFCAFGLESLALTGLAAIPAVAYNMFDDPKNAAMAFFASSAVSLGTIIKTNILGRIVDYFDSVFAGTTNIAHYNKKIGELQTQIELSYDSSDREFR